jgi:hypothetical protein
MAGEWMVMMNARTLTEMSPAERLEMILLVVQALEGVAEDAGDRGDQQSALNAMYLACSIRGCTIETSTDLIRASEILLEQGISYVASISERIEQFHDGSDHQPRILH